MMSKSPARSNTSAMWMHSATFGSMSLFSDQPDATVDRSRADVTESAVANSVTSWPSNTKPSESSEANRSQGP
jgi:hypothetical protein